MEAVPKAPIAPRLWLAFNASAVAVGWGLSTLDLLSPGTGLAFLVVWMGLGIHTLIRAGIPTAPGPRWRRRWRRWPALAFGVLFLLSLMGGLLHAPNNIDALAYRTPRVLHWIAEGQWHWIPAPYQRLNTRACGFEWVTAPMLAVFGSDRPLFLLNLSAFALLPALVFSSLRRCGIGGRAAWTWMWLFPGGYCFALQAGSIGNDLYGATLSAAAMAFALRARQTRSASDAAWSLIAAGLMTGAKSSNLPLLLPWLCFWWPGGIALLRRPTLGLPACILALAVSLAPISILNHRHTGDWTGLKAEDAWIRPPGYLTCALHNAGLMSVQNLLPPIVPAAGAFNNLVQRALPESWKSTLDGFAENGRAAYTVRELPGEEHAGLGFGVTWLLLLPLFHALRRPNNGLLPIRSPRTWLLLLPVLCLGPYFAKSGITTAGRILAPYYPWILPIALLAGHAGSAVRSRWFQRLGIAFSLLGIGLLILLPTRPLWPARTVLGALFERFPNSALSRALTVYEVYAHRADVFAPLRQWIPPDCRVIGFITVNDAESSLWKPYGKHRIRHILPTDSIEVLRREGMGCAVLNVGDFTARYGQTPTEWAAIHGGRIAGETDIRLLAKEPAQPFAVVIW